jgi:hypothetical protein
MTTAMKHILILTLCLLTIIGTSRAGVVAEGFDQTSAEPIVIAGVDTGEKVVRFLSSQLAWGGFCETARRGIFTIVDPSGETCVVFNDGAAVPGSYLYTRFDKAVGWQPLDLSGNGARVVLTLFWCRADMGLADALGIRVVTSGVHWEFEHVRKHALMNVFKPVSAA